MTYESVEHMPLIFARMQIFAVRVTVLRNDGRWSEARLYMVSQFMNGIRDISPFSSYSLRADHQGLPIQRIAVDKKSLEFRRRSSFDDIFCDPYSPVNRFAVHQPGLQTPSTCNPFGSSSGLSSETSLSNSARRVCRS